MRAPTRYAGLVMACAVLAGAASPAAAQTKLSPPTAIGTPSPAKPLPRPAPRIAAAPRPLPKPVAVPLPLPRPRDLPGAAVAASPTGSAPVPVPAPARPAAETPAPAAPATPAPTPVPATPAPDDAAIAACRADFAARGGETAKSDAADKPAEATAACTIPGPLVFARVRVADGETVTLESAITVRCTMALELASWIREDLAPIAKRHGAALAEVTSVGGYACRMRNGQAGAPISEHASGNAFDFQGLKLTDGKVIDLTRADPATADLRKEVQKSACARFRTVLGPGADSSHVNHIHVDMRQRRNDFRMCQWNVD